MSSLIKNWQSNDSLPGGKYGNYGKYGKKNSEKLHIVELMKKWYNEKGGNSVINKKDTLLINIVKIIIEMEERCIWKKMWMCVLIKLI